MSCYNNPQCFVPYPQNNFNDSSQVSPSEFNMNNSSQGQFMSPIDNINNTETFTDQWGGTMPMDAQSPSFPLPVQPYGNGTSFITSEPAEALPETLTDPFYTQGYLRSNIGRLMRVEFLIGTQTTNRVGYLREVGANFIVLESMDLGNLMMCDLCSIKFATTLGSSIDPRLASLYE